MLKNNKGISLTTAVMTVVIILILLTTISYTAIRNTEVKKVNNLYSDLRELTDQVQLYYAKHNKLPVTGESYTVTPTNVEKGIDGSYEYISIEDAKLTFILKSESEGFSKDNLYNPNDYDDNGTGKAVYYQIDLSQFDNITLNNYSGIYLVNERSKTVYYYDGLEVNDKKYYQLPLNYIDVPSLDELV